jgi:hypothetical protein
MGEGQGLKAGGDARPTGPCPPHPNPPFYRGRGGAMAPAAPVIF